MSTGWRPQPHFVLTAGEYLGSALLGAGNPIPWLPRDGYADIAFIVLSTGGDVDVRHKSMTTAGGGSPSASSIVIPSGETREVVSIDGKWFKDAGAFVVPAATTALITPLLSGSWVKAA